MRRVLTIIGSMLLALALAIPAMAADYDLVILIGRGMDPETMCDDIANVGIKGGRIATISKDKISGKETVDAKGLVVTPGFVDTDVHGFDPFAVKMVLRDGPTTALNLELGATNFGKWYAQKMYSRGKWLKGILIDLATSYARENVYEHF